MKAIVRHKYGSPDVLKLEDVEKPTPGDDEVLVEILAASVSAADSHILSGKPFVLRLFFGLLKPKYRIPGSDIAGRVEAVGKNVTQFQPGDEVFGDISACGWGAFAEYACVSENALVLKPANLSFEEAAAVPMSASTALLALRDHGEIQQGQKVLIHGASGGVGTYAVQIAKSFGAEVTAVCSTRNLDITRSIGADHVIDYTQEDFAENGQLYDLIMSVAGDHSVFEYTRALSPKGIYVMAGGSVAQLFYTMLMAPWISKRGGKQVRNFTAMPNKENLAYLKELLEAGKLVPVIDRRYTLSEVPDALRYFNEGHARGKVVITV